MDEITAIFADLGFAVAEGPQVESDWYNFDALNIPPEHPARQEHDTFYMARADGDNRPPHVLRTHTSPVQIRHMEAHGVPCRIIAPGRVYRADYDQTHTPMFHQVEGLAIDRDISMANLKWVLEEFCRAFFEVDGVELKFRASHFPFTEPSAEVDIRCSFAGGQLRIGEGDDWLEILGSGMVHPKVLAAAGVDPDDWQGFAFGMGIDRLAMLKYGIPDLRELLRQRPPLAPPLRLRAARRPDARGRDQPVTPVAGASVRPPHLEHRQPPLLALAGLPADRRARLQPDQRRADRRQHRHPALARCRPSAGSTMRHRLLAPGHLVAEAHLRAEVDHVARHLRRRQHGRPRHLAHQPVAELRRRPAHRRGRQLLQPLALGRVEHDRRLGVWRRI